MQDTKEFKELSSPFKIKNYQLRNRIVFAPVSTRMAMLDGSISETMLAYYADKALGGAAMVITETFHVDNKASRFTIVQPSIYNDRFIAGLSNLADEIKNAGSLAIAQIGHAGRQSFFNANNCQPVAPSKILNGPTKDCHELTKEEIDDIIQAFSDAACRAEIAGFDGIEIHAGNGYLINEFLSPYTNRRNDEYGKNKELLLIKIINAISKRISKHLILGVRLGCADFVEGGFEPDDAILISSLLPKDKIDYIHTSAGTSDSNDYTIQPIYHKRALLEDIAKDLKKNTSIPIILTGSVNDPFLAERVLKQESADLIGMGRPILADPTLPIKIIERKTDEICPCIRCNQGCLARVRNLRTIRCSVNPNLGYEWSKDSISKMRLNQKNLNVLIAGAGPAGITAAIRSKELGFQVKLFEKDDKIGGLLNTAKAESFKKDINDYLNYLINRLYNSGVEIIKSTKVDFSIVSEKSFDIFFNATGSIPFMPNIPKNLSYKVVDVRRLLTNLKSYNDFHKIVIIGGGSVGCEVGYTLAMEGKDVMIIEQASDILLDLNPISALALRHLLNKNDIKIQKNTRFVSFDPEGIIADKDDLPIPADLVVIAMGSRSNNEFEEILKESRWKLGINYLCIGDAKKIGRIHDAVHDTYWNVSNLLANYL